MTKSQNYCTVDNKKKALTARYSHINGHRLYLMLLNHIEYYVNRLLMHIESRDFHIVKQK